MAEKSGLKRLEQGARNDDKLIMPLLHNPGGRFISWLALLCLAAATGAAAAAPAPAAPPAAVLENLAYRVSLGPWDDVALVHISLKELAPGRFLAEFSGAANGVWSLLQRWLPERYATEMVLQDGRLKPVLYREEVWIKGSRWVREFRFDYAQGRLEYWRRIAEGDFRKIWQLPLKEPIYDPLSLFYNARLGGFGDLAGGETLKIQTIPTPDPVEMIFNLGPEKGPTRQVMLTVKGKTGEELGPYFLEVGPQWVPRTAWLRVLVFGKLAGHLVDPGGIMQLERLKPAQVSRRGQGGK
jgi:hypothetical protein